MKKIITAIAIVSIVTILSCTKDTTSNCGTTTFKYSTDISVVLNNKCNTSGCHNSSAAGGLNLTNYNTVRDKSPNISNRVNTNSMPPAGSPALTLDEKNQLSSWIGACSPNN